jgi:hypothetical protein
MDPFEVGLAHIAALVWNSFDETLLYEDIKGLPDWDSACSKFVAEDPFTQVLSRWIFPIEDPVPDSLRHLLAQMFRC